jgi:acetyl-CoA carboxylase biotin carboxylase subunit
MRIVRDDDGLERAYDAARTEAGASFGNSAVYIEKFIEEPHHIEIQVAGDQYGAGCHLSERDCSVQRRHQKLVEEAPSAFVDADLRKRMGDAAVKAVTAISYEGVGTIEFLVDKYKNFYFMEMNTRIQVEHPVTEEVMDFDLIKEQILIASGTPISGELYFPDKMHAIECRVNAEDPLNNFAPSPGKITALHTPKGYGVRVDTHIYAGYTVPPYYDSLLAKVICRAKTREECIVKMERALSEFIIEGVKTTIPFSLALMKNEEFRSGIYDTGLLERFDYVAAIKEMHLDEHHHLGH